MLLGGCASALPSPEPQTIRLGCPAVTPCTLPPVSPQTNGDLITDSEIDGNAWAECAAQVDMIYQHQQAQHAQAQQP
ncbi:Rz1-like lysis system protein LysC [Halopseudomonas phragmitis]|uniref:Rz1-like lysis system protein LysC n=1 Tax=Halopseudomonas phragmitis TaxID=1931241 RepID=UPI001E37DCC1|nr:Rz1-like lysis system protein LysC [Halopseudomonas phragmitis]